MNNRHQFRAPWYDYDEGLFFVTICSHNKQHIFGRIINNNIILNKLGQIINLCINEIPSHHNRVEICNYVIMPNHLHLVISVGTRYIASEVDTSMHGYDNIGCLKSSVYGEFGKNIHHNSRLAVIIGSFKAAVTRMANKQLNMSSVTGGRDVSRPYWQTRYHEHLIRNRLEFEKIMTYVDNNVTRWTSDCYYNE